WVLDLRIEIDGKLMPANVTYSAEARGRSAQHNLEQFRSFHERGWSAEAQLEAMDQEGIDVGVVYPTRGLYAQGIDGMEPKLAAAIARAYNNWLYDFCAANPQRLIGAGMISPFEIDDAVAEAQRAVKELGFKGIFLRPNPVNGRNWHDPYYEPLWSQLEALDVPLGFHEGLGAYLPQVGDRFARNVMLRHTVCHPGEQMLAAVSFCGGGILERHPRLRVAFLEGNASWVPFLLWRMDEHYEWLGGVFFGVTSVTEMLALAAKVDANPLFGSIWVGDSLGAKPRPDSLALLGALASATQRVRLGVGCMASFPVRDPLVFAYQWATLD